MDFIEILSVDSSRLTIDIASEAVGNDIERFRMVFDLCFDMPYPISMRAARVVQLCCEKFPKLIYPNLEESFEKMLKSDVEGVRRGFLKIYAENIDLRKFKDPGLLISYCFEWLSDPEQPISVRVYVMDILCKYTKIEPDLNNELAGILESLIYDGSIAVRSRAKYALKKIYNS